MVYFCSSWEHQNNADFLVIVPNVCLLLNLRSNEEEIFHGNDLFLTKFKDSALRKFSSYGVILKIQPKFYQNFKRSSEFQNKDVTFCCLISIFTASFTVLISPSSFFQSNNVFLSIATYKRVIQFRGVPNRHA